MPPKSAAKKLAKVKVRNDMIKHELRKHSARQIERRQSRRTRITKRRARNMTQRSGKTLIKPRSRQRKLRPSVRRGPLWHA